MRKVSFFLWVAQCSVIFSFFPFFFSESCDAMWFVYFFFCSSRAMLCDASLKDCWLQCSGLGIYLGYCAAFVVTKCKSSQLCVAVFNPDRPLHYYYPDQIRDRDRLTIIITLITLVINLIITTLTRSEIGTIWPSYYYHPHPDHQLDHHHPDQIRDGDQGYSTEIGKFCGSDFPPIITSSGRSLWLRLVMMRLKRMVTHFVTKFERFLSDPPQYWGSGSKLLTALAIEFPKSNHPFFFFL